MMKELINFEGNNINVIIGENSEPLFELYNVAVALGYGRKKIVKGKEYQEIQKTRITQTIKNAEIEPIKIDGQPFLTEEEVYDFMFEAKTDKCKAFRKWLSHEVLPTIRQNGAYVLDSITEEQEDNLRYATSNSRKELFMNVPIENLNEIYNECMNYNKKKSAPERIKIEKEIIATLQNRANTAIENGSAPIALVIQMEISKIQKKVTERSNRSYGTRLGNANKKLNIVQEQLEEAYEYINYIEPSEDEWKYLNLHGFSINSMYEPYVNKVTNEAGERKTRAYRMWAVDFAEEMTKLDLDIDFSNGVDVFLKFDYMPRFDCHNFSKSFIDCFANYYGVNDNNFQLKCCDKNNHVNSYDEGRIWFVVRPRTEE